MHRVDGEVDLLALPLDERDLVRQPVVRHDLARRVDDS